MFKEKVLRLFMEFIDIYAVEFTPMLAEMHFGIATDRIQGTRDGTHYELIMQLYTLVKENLSLSLTDPNEYIRRD